MIDLLLLAIVLIGWSGEDIFASINSKKYGYGPSMLIAMAAGLLILTAYNLLTGAFTQTNLTPHLPLLITFGILNAIALISYFKALEIGKLAAMSPAVSSYVLIAILSGIFILNEPINQTKLALSILAITASVLTLIGDIRKIKIENGAHLLIPPFIIWGFNATFGKTLTQVPATITTMSLFLFALILALIAFRKQKIKTNAIKYSALSGISAVIGWFAFFEGIKTNDYYLWVSLAALFPLISFTVAVIFLKEKLNTRQKLTAIAAVIFAALAAA